MEVLLYVGGVFGLLLGAFIFVEKPYFIVGILVFMIAYLFNLNVPGPLDLRGLLLLMIFARLFLFDKNNLQLVMNVLFKSKWFYLTLIFLFSYAIVTYFNVAGASAKEPVKSFVLNVIAIITGFIIISNKEGRNAFAFGIIITGLISVFDLVFHYVQFGGISGELTLFRPLDLLSTREDLRTNHNFPGMLIGFAFILAYLQFILKKWTKYISLIFMIIFAIGIFLSTSRSTILGLIVVFLIVSFTIKNTNVNFKKIIYSLIIFSFFYLGFYFYYEFFVTNKTTKDKIVNVIYYRLYEEPAKTFGLIDGQDFDKYSGKEREGSISFRINKATHDINKFNKKPLEIVTFGLGKGGYDKIGQRIFLKDVNYSYVLAPHNGYVMILVEYGYLGLIIFLIVILGVIFVSIKNIAEISKTIPMFYFYIFIMFYAIGQNSELTNTFAFVIIGGMIANITIINIDEEEGDEE